MHVRNAAVRGATDSRRGRRFDTALPRLRVTTQSWVASLPTALIQNRHRMRQMRGTWLSEEMTQPLHVRFVIDVEILREKMHAEPGGANGIDCLREDARCS